MATRSRSKILSGDEVLVPRLMERRPLRSSAGPMPSTISGFMLRPVGKVAPVVLSSLSLSLPLLVLQSIVELSLLCLEMASAFDGKALRTSGPGTCLLMRFEEDNERFCAAAATMYVKQRSVGRISYEYYRSCYRTRREELPTRTSWPRPEERRRRRK